MQTTLGQLLVNDALPEDMRDYDRTLDKKSLGKLLGDVARRYPDRYRDISHKIANIGRQVAQDTGGFSFGLRHLRKSQASTDFRNQIEPKIHRILDDDTLDDNKREQLLIRTVGDRQKEQQEAVFNEAKANDNPLAHQLAGAGRGNKMNLSSLLGSDMLYADHRGNVIPVPVMRSYSEGLRPWEYWAGSYGARKGVIDVKFATQDAGFLCLARGTQVRLPYGESCNIEQLKSGDFVLGADASGHTFPVKVTAAFDNGPKDVWRYRFRVGKARDSFITVEATENHKVLATMRRGRAGTTHGDKNSILTPTQLPLSRAGFGFRLTPIQGLADGYDRAIGSSEPRALLLGLLLGDGGLTGSTVYLSTADQVLVDYLRDYLITLGLELRWRGEGHPYEYAVLDRQRTGHGQRNRLRTWLRKLGVLGKFAHEKCVPSEAYRWDNPSVAAMIAGVYESDGCVTLTNNSTVPAIILTMTSEIMVYTVRDLLALRFGIHSCPIRRVDVAEKGNHDGWCIVINNRDSILKFARYIPLPGRKAQVLADLLQGMEPQTRQDDFVYSYVEKEYVGVVPTYDIEVDHPDHLFVLANGAIVSNSKQLNQVAHRLVVVDNDHENQGDNRDNMRGMPVDTEDPDNEGALLAKDTGPYKRNTVITPKIAADLKHRGLGRILVRSPIIGGSIEGGIYARDAGVRENGTLPGRGELPGLAAVQAFSEPLSQAQLSSKHTGGVAGEGKAVSGFDTISQMIQVPKVFKGGATHSEVDGPVGRSEDAPAGGKYAWIGGERHYVAAGHNLTVNPGDRVEAGDVISEGWPNPAKVVEHKGIGEGRRYFTKVFGDAMSNAGIKAHRRNVELLSRGLINHVRLTDEMGEYVPDDMVPYSTLEHIYEPRKDAQDVEPSLARDKYLEKPVLHYSIGTKIRPSVQKDLAEFGVKKVKVHDKPPPFKAEMVRGMANLAQDPDWMVRMYGSGLKGSLLDAAHRGAVSDEEGTSFVPSLAKAVDFGRQGLIHTPEAGLKVSAELSGGSGGSATDGSKPAGGSISAPTAPTAPASPLASAAPKPEPYKPQHFFDSYSPNSLMGGKMLGMEAPLINKLGPLAPAAIFGNLDYSALGSLTKGLFGGQQRETDGHLDNPERWLGSLAKQPSRPQLPPLSTSVAPASPTPPATPVPAVPAPQPAVVAPAAPAPTPAAPVMGPPAPAATTPSTPTPAAEESQPSPDTLKIMAEVTQQMKADPQIVAMDNQLNAAVAQRNQLIQQYNQSSGADYETRKQLWDQLTQTTNQAEQLLDLTKQTKSTKYDQLMRERGISDQRTSQMLHAGRMTLMAPVAVDAARLVAWNRMAAPAAAGAANTYRLGSNLARGTSGGYMPMSRFAWTGNATRNVEQFAKMTPFARGVSRTGAALNKLSPYIPWVMEGVNQINSTEGAVAANEEVNRSLIDPISDETWKDPSKFNWRDGMNLGMTGMTAAMPTTFIPARVFGDAGTDARVALNRGADYTGVSNWDGSIEGMPLRMGVNYAVGTGMQINDESKRMTPTRHSFNPVVEIPAGVKALANVTPTGTTGVKTIGGGLGEALFGGARRVTDRIQQDTAGGWSGGTDPRDMFASADHGAGQQAARKTLWDFDRFRVAKLEEQAAKTPGAWIDWTAQNSMGQQIGRVVRPNPAASNNP